MNAYLLRVEAWLRRWRLVMPLCNKCFFTVFCRGQPFKGYKLKLYGEPITYNAHPRFLGVTFDESLCFNENWKIVRARCLKRLNILKIISHRSWGLNIGTIRSVFYCLIRSVFDFRFFAFGLMNDANTTSAQALQNNCIRAILKDWNSGPIDLATKSGIAPVSTRVTEFGNRFIGRCLYYENPLICPLIEEFQSLFGSRPVNKCMPLSHLKLTL